MTVDIISSVLDGERFLPELLRSLRSQTHTDWRLWVRDDGSKDRTVDIVRAQAAADSRIHLIHVGGPRLGVAGGFGWLLERLPADSRYVMCADADDVWLPHKVEHTLREMRAAESEVGDETPVLVHTDLIVVDEALSVVHPSFWEFSGIDPEPVTLRRIVVSNVATAPTVMMNRALRELIGKTPPEAMFQDWWYALVAAAFGRIVAVRGEGTVLYRQHGTNAVGARPDPRVPAQELPGLIVNRLSRTREFRSGLAQAARQAGALLDRYGERLSEDDREFLRAFSRIPQTSFLRRKIDLLRFRRLPEHGVLQTLGILFRG
jgi:hypothetical protein